MACSTGWSDVPSRLFRCRREERDTLGRLTRLTQSNWHISYLAYVGESALPARMALAYDTLSLRLIIDRWDLTE